MCTKKKMTEILTEFFSFNVTLIKHNTLYFEAKKQINDCSIQLVINSLNQLIKEKNLKFIWIISKKYEYFNNINCTINNLFDDKYIWVYNPNKFEVPQTGPVLSCGARILLHCKKTNQYLVVKKKNDKEWYCPGGYMDLTDKCIYAAALRELWEETGISIEQKEYKYPSIISIVHFPKDSKYYRCENIMITFFKEIDDKNMFKIQIKSDVDCVEWKMENEIKIHGVKNLKAYFYFGKKMLCYNEKYRAYIVQ